MNGDDTRLTLSVEEVASRLGISRTHTFALIRSGALPVVRLGRRVLIPVEQLNAILSRGNTSPE